MSYLSYRIVLAGVAAAIVAGLLMIFILFFSFGATANAQLRIEDRLKIGDIAIKYDSNRWILASGNSATSAQLKCRECRRAITIGIAVDDQRNVCRAETVGDLLRQRMREVTQEEFTPYATRQRKKQQAGKMTLQIAMAYNGCHVRTDFVFACGEYRGKTYSLWLLPEGCAISGASGPADRMMSGLLSGVVAP